MGRILNAIFILLALSLVVLAGDTHSGKRPSRAVFYDARNLETNYAGPGREEPAPTDINEVLIGYFGPNTPSHPEGGNMWCAASLAIEEANRAGGYKGLPFRLVAGWSDNPWGTGISKVVRMAYVDKVWAIIGGIDGPSTHLAEQVVAKARLTLLNPASSDKTVNLANVPWMFSCLPGDHLQAPILAHAIASRIGQKPFLLVSAVDHDSHLFTVELARSFSQHKLVPSYHFEFNTKEKDFTELAEKIVEAKTHALVLIAGAEQSAHLISAVRERNFAGPVFGGPCMGRRGFLEEAGRAADGVIFPSLYTPRKNSDSFEKKFTSRFGYRPDYLAAHTYDTVNLLIAAIRKAGLNRARIRDAVRELSPWAGVTGAVKWDTLGGNSRTVQLGTVRAGRFVGMAPPFGIPASLGVF
ncbi:MAG: ABC transporter substrate-binding protein [Planctomycetota bacterium]|jgi:ABC-type branched-subunit amino acid transport system substrate-binding protein